MKNLLLLLLLLNAFVLKINAQSEVGTDSIPVFNQNLKPKNEQLNNYLELDKSMNSSTQNHGLEYVPLHEQVPTYRNIEYPVLPYYKGPIYNDNPIDLHNPFTHDYGYSAIYGLSDQSYLTTYSMRETYPTLGAVSFVNAQFGYQPASWLVVSGGPYVSKYNVFGNHYNDFGATGSMKFIVSDRLRINAYGQYSVYGKENRIGAPMGGMYPQTYYGGGVEFKITEKFGLEGGVMREFNPMKGKWENRPYINPVFYGGKRK